MNIKKVIRNLDIPEKDKNFVLDYISKLNSELSDYKTFYFITQISSF